LGSHHEYLLRRRHAVGYTAYSATPLLSQGERKHNEADYVCQIVCREPALVHRSASLQTLSFYFCNMFNTEKKTLLRNSK
jgi:hypothetical protein